MRVCVFGLGHLGSVTAACVASLGHQVIGLDPDAELVAELTAHAPRVLEPELPELLSTYHPRFTTDVTSAVGNAEILWLTDDTPVDENDTANVRWVLDRAEPVLTDVTDGALVIVSSQLPVGSVASLERSHPTLSFACMPENLRLGRGVESFLDPSRIVIGTRVGTDMRIVELFGHLADRVIWMSIEAAEITKHALNAYLATSVVFANELAGICETNGADARDVERGLRTDPRVGQHAYVSAGPSFAGGTLARDVQYLRALGAKGSRTTALLDAVLHSNTDHSMWAQRRLEELAPSTVAVWGLSYKSGTNSIRRSSAVQLCQWLLQQGITVQAHDPAADGLPAWFDADVARTVDPLEATFGADALVVAVAWPLYRTIDPGEVTRAMRNAVVIDPTRYLDKAFGGRQGSRYITVGAAA